RRPLLLWLMLILSVSIIHAGDLLPDLDDDLLSPETVEEKTIAAAVDDREITLEEVVNIWQPAWRNTMARCEEGTLDTTMAEQELQVAWESSLAEAVRNEIFYREASLFISEKISMQAENMSSEESYGKDEAAEANYQYLHNRVKAAVEQQIEDLVATNIQNHTQRAGGKSQLLALLAASNTTWQDWREQLRRQVMISLYQNESVPLTEGTEFSPSEIRAYYKRYQNEFLSPPKIHFRHIFINFAHHGGEVGARKLASEIINRLQKNEISFDAAIKEFSDDAPSVACGGLDPIPDGLGNTMEALGPARLAWLSKVRDAAAVIPTGKTSPLLLSEAGCHIIQVLSQEPGELLPFSDAQEKIVEILSARKRHGEVEELYQKLRAKAKVRILIPNYPAKYSWSEVQQNPALRRSINLELGSGQ
ncbi:MAG: peptidylprolyl isomerase, partial [Planctomycetes bacterium]|nr:peptidylprolyl isomerase [Planctomycetota bacterium]